MDFYEVINKRTSIKKFRNTEIDDEKLGRMINAAMLSPSWKNKTSYRFIIVDDKQKKDMLAAAIKNDSNDAANAVREAPVAALIVGEPYESGEVDRREYYLVDAGIAMEHFILAAANEGYGTCWIASFDEDKIREAFSIPNNVRVIGMTPVGEIAENKEHYPMKDVNEHVYINDWNTPYREKKEKVMS